MEEVKNIKNKDIYYPLEGYLYPETYNFSMNVTVEEIIKTMLDQSNKVFSKYKSLIESGKMEPAHYWKDCPERQ